MPRIAVSPAPTFKSSSPRLPAAAQVIERKSLHEKILFGRRQTIELDLDAVAFEPNQANLQRRNRCQANQPTFAAEFFTDLQKRLLASRPSQ
ncbi:MAG: hypothetical protein Q7J42_11895 [Sulfuritalea sp.]|nr:hypothetical protein [Sulfuritalea sp.]